VNSKCDYFSDSRDVSRTPGALEHAGFKINVVKQQKQALIAKLISPGEELRVTLLD